MSLEKYHKKRNFKLTPEPAGKNPRAKKDKTLLYVIQKHAASHLHYDLRLELNGTLKSWAVPKGPSLDPHVKHLAVQVEDHPIEYGNFEGIIPSGQYGGGTVMLWDKGTWQAEEENPAAAYRKGHLVFQLKGKKLKGLWQLIRMKPDKKGNKKNWLLMKIEDKYAKPESKYDITKKQDLSVATKKTMEEIAEDKKKVKKSKKSNTTSSPRIPDFLSPQLATLVSEPPNTNNYIHELKYDGYRILSFVHHDLIRLKTRNNKDWSKKLIPLIEALKTLKLSNTILDGELVALDVNSHSNFELLQQAVNEDTDIQLAYYIFDILYHNGKDIRNLPQLKRKEILKSILQKNKNKFVRYSDHIQGKGAAVFKKACKLGLEGIVSKTIDAPYIDRRGTHWLKSKCIKRQEFIIGGFTPPQGERTGFGALLIGYYDNKNHLRYAGRVGTGFTTTTLKKIHQTLLKHRSNKMPFSHTPPASKKVIWVKPVLVGEVEFTEWTRDGCLRHPSFKGLRKDKKAKEVKREKTTPLKAVPTKEETIKLTHPERILYPKQKITKLDLLNYYKKVNKLILPHLINRPLTLKRCPDSVEKACFYQRHIHGKSKNLYTIKVNGEQYFYIKDIEGLFELVQIGSLEIHPWGSTIKYIDQPDRIILDLDPDPKVPWKNVISAAKLIRKKLENLKLKSFVKTTGGKGLHIVIPIKPHYSWKEIKNFTHQLVDSITKEYPDQFVTTITKSKRIGKIFLDYLRNQSSATAIAPYSTRANDKASVATPLDWKELTVRIKSDTYTLKNIDRRLSKLKKDPWADFFKTRQSIKLT